MKSSFRKYGLALSLGLAAFLLYLPSLGSGFVYDGVLEVREGFFTSLANLPDVLSLKVLGMDLLLRDRPGQLLYLMLIAAACGTKPFGYHLCGNLLHAANAAFLSILCVKLISAEAPDEVTRWPRRISWAVATGVLIFALHPLAVEPVAAINFSSDLLASFFTLLALLAATSFDPRRTRAAWLTGTIGVSCVFFAVASKESGASACSILVAYWFLFRRQDPRVPWLCFLGSAVLVTAAFTIAQLQAAPSSARLPFGLYPIHSLQGFLSIQPRAWALMALKIIWPTSLSVDYTLENVYSIPLVLALPILIGIFVLQAWLSIQSRIGALGVAFYWLGLAPVSNFFPLTHFVADRYYYLPMLGVALQLVALFCMAVRLGEKFRWVMAPFVVVLLPLALLSLSRETVFSNDLSLWTATVQVSPSSSVAHEDLGVALMDTGSLAQALDQLREASRINPLDRKIHDNIGVALSEKGLFKEAVNQFREAAVINPSDGSVYNNLGTLYFRYGQTDKALAQYQHAVELSPADTTFRLNLASAYDQNRQPGEAIDQLREVVRREPDDLNIRNRLGIALGKNGQTDEAIAEFQDILKKDPARPAAHNNLGNLFLQKGLFDDAITQYQEAIRENPADARLHYSLGRAFRSKGEKQKAIEELQAFLRLSPNDAEGKSELAQAMALKN